MERKNYNVIASIMNTKCNTRATREHQPHVHLIVMNVHPLEDQHFIFSSVIPSWDDERWIGSPTSPHSLHPLGSPDSLVFLPFKLILIDASEQPPPVSPSSSFPLLPSREASSEYLPTPLPRLTTPGSLGA